MSTTRSQKRKNFQQENSENVSDGFASPVVVGCYLLVVGWILVFRKTLERMLKKKWEMNLRVSIPPLDWLG